MRMSKVDDLLAPVYGRVIPGLYSLATSRAAQRLSAGGPKTVLEVGAGPGHILGALAKRNPTAHTVGVDISTAMLRQARRTLSKTNTDAHLVCADGVRLPFSDGVFEGVVASFLLDLFQKEKIPDALREMLRVLAPGGRIVVASLQVSNPLLKHAMMFAYRVLPTLVGSRIRPIDFRQFLEGTGLRVLQDEEIPEAAGTRVLTLVKVVG
jgi:ubiquinone/menaquinone biosynthesis C-methylase UbiE